MIIDEFRNVALFLRPSSGPGRSSQHLFRKLGLWILSTAYQIAFQEIHFSKLLTFLLYVQVSLHCYTYKEVVCMVVSIAKPRTASNVRSPPPLLNQSSTGYRQTMRLISHVLLCCIVCMLHGNPDSIDSLVRASSGTHLLRPRSSPAEGTTQGGIFLPTRPNQPTKTAQEGGPSAGDSLASGGKRSLGGWYGVWSTYGVSLAPACTYWP